MPHPQESPSAQRVGRPLYGGAFALPPSGTASFILPDELILPGDAFTILERSPDRAIPGCIHFGTCGGCHYQHGVYPAQLAWKQTILRDLLSGAGINNLPAIEVLAADPWAYRNRIRVRLQMVDGILRAGYSTRGTTSFLPITMCPIAAPLLWQGIAAVLAASAAEPRFTRWLAHAAELELFTNGHALEATLFLADPAVARQEPQTFPALTEHLRAALPTLTALAALPDPELSRRTRRAWEGQTWGAPGLNYAVGPRQHWVSRGAFFQVNRFLVEPLVDLVLSGLPPHIALAWDLFAGVGLFTQPLAARADRVVAVEGAGSAAKDLAQGLARLTRLENRPANSLTAVQSPTLDFLTARQFDRDRPDVVILDPPRAGLGSDGTALLAKIAPATITYVSCDPTTLARDLAILIHAGYHLTRLTLVDLFPQTFHLETVAHLTRT